MGRERPSQTPIRGHRRSPGLTRVVRKQARVNLLYRVESPTKRIQPVTYPPLPTPSMATGARPFTPHSCHLLYQDQKRGWLPTTDLAPESSPGSCPEVNRQARFFAGADSDPGVGESAPCLAWLWADGLCLPEKMEGLLAWPGQELVLCGRHTFGLLTGLAHGEVFIENTPRGTRREAKAYPAWKCSDAVCALSTPQRRRGHGPNYGRDRGRSCRQIPDDGSRPGRCPR